MRLWKGKWHGLLAPAILLLQSVIESEDQTAKQRMTCKKRHTTPWTNQQVSFPKSKSDYIAACLKLFNGFLMPKGKKNPNFFVWHKRSFVWHKIWALITSPAVFLKGPLLLLILSHAECSEILQMLWLFCAHVFAQVKCFFWKVHLPKPSFFSNSTDQFIFKDRFSSKATPSETFLPSCFQSSPIKQGPPKGRHHWLSSPHCPEQGHGRCSVKCCWANEGWLLFVLTSIFEICEMYKWNAL